MPTCCSERVRSSEFGATAAQAGCEIEKNGRGWLPSRRASGRDFAHGEEVRALSVRAAVDALLFLAPHSRDLRKLYPCEPSACNPLGPAGLDWAPSPR